MTDIAAARPMPPRSVEELEELLSRPAAAAIEALRTLPGDIVVLGAGGKMGPTLARMARRALDALGRRDAVIAVSRFSDSRARSELERHDVRVIQCDLTSAHDVAALPDAPLVVHLTGQKFGTSGNPGATWATNVVAPALAAQRYARSRIVALSSGNVYPLMPSAGRGATEDTAPAPVGEYAWSCLGRERVFDAAARAGTQVALVRLNYASDLRYGVLTDLAVRVQRGVPIDLGTPRVNVIWQGDANAAVLRSLPAACAPPFILNVTGVETLSVRTLAEELGARLGRAPVFTGAEGTEALLSDASRSRALFGPPSLPVTTLLEWTAHWIRSGLPLLDKPTRFEVRDGAF